MVLAATFDTLRAATIEWLAAFGERRARRASRDPRRGKGDFMRTVMQDARYAVRVLAKRPGFTAAAALTLALGVGATTAMFSVVNSVLLRPLPIPESDRVVIFCETHESVAGFCIASPPNVEDWSEQSTAFESMGLARGWPFVLKTDDGAEGVAGGIGTPGFFQVMRFTPRLGRLFTEEDMLEGNRHVVVLSHAMWQGQFGSDPNIVGRRIVLGGEPYEVLGVLGPEARVPQMEYVDLWAPLHFDPRDEEARSWRGFRAVGRLRDGTSLAEARAEMRTITTRLAQQYPETNAGWGLQVIPLHERVVGSTRPLLLTFLGAVWFVLLIGCANVANLMLARTAGRKRELAVRTALGAERGRLVRLLMGESLALSIIGGAVGVLLAAGAVRAFVALAPGNIPRLEEVGLDGRALVFAAAVSIFTSFLFGLAPAIQGTGLDLSETLKEGERKNAAKATLRMRGALIVSEVSLAVVLLVGAGLLFQSFTTLLHWEPGFDRDNLLTVWLLASSGKYSSGDEVTELFERAATEVSGLPAVSAVGATSAGPLFGGREPGEFVIDGREDEPRVARWYDVDSGYFATLGVPLLAGRGFSTADTRDAPPVAIVNETLARRFWPGQNPLGRSIAYEDRPPATVVGVVGDVQPFEYGTPVEPEIYWPKRQYPRGATYLVIRTTTDPASLIRPVRDRLRALDPDMRASGFATMEELAARQLVRPKFNMLLVGGFAFVAIVLAGIGIYGVVSYAVAQRTREIGIRVALGARGGNVIRWVVGKGMVPVAIGVLGGVAGALALTRLLTSLLYGVQPRDPTTLGVTALFVLSISLLACYVPARRATKVDAVVALRAE